LAFLGRSRGGDFFGAHAKKVVACESLRRTQEPQTPCDAAFAILLRVREFFGVVTKKGVEAGGEEFGPSKKTTLRFCLVAHLSPRTTRLLKNYFPATAKKSAK
jgi:hypothetical protein